MTRSLLSLAGISALLVSLISALVSAQEPSSAPRGSLIEDRAARKLLDAGDARMEAEEPDKALEIWASIIERYPRSRHRFDAHVRLGDHLLESERKFEEARGHFEAATSDENPDDSKRAEATLKLGICFFEGRNYGKAFTVLRDLIESFPASDHINRAYYYIGLGHFRLGHYSRAIDALEKVGTAFSEDDARLESVEAGRRLFIRIEDLDLAVLETGETVDVVCSAGNGDKELVPCSPIGRNVHLVLGSIPTSLGTPVAGNGMLEVLGGDTITVTYTDRHTSERKVDQERTVRVLVVGTGIPQVMDGSFSESIDGVVLGKSANLQITDPDQDRSSKPDSVTARISILRRKSEAEIGDELAAIIASGQQSPGLLEGEDPKNSIPQYREIDALTLTFTEVQTTPEDSSSATHSGIFRARVPLVRTAAADTSDDRLQALPADKIKISYDDEANLEGKQIERTAEAACIEGELGDVRVTRTEVSDRELHLKTRLRTAGALTQIGNHYKSFGLGDRAKLKYSEALEVCSEIEIEARIMGGATLEETYVQLWRTYFAMEELNRALALSRRLLAEFPNSTYVDEAMLQQAHVVRKEGDLPRAINLYATVVKLRQSPLRGEAQFGIAECYEEMALAAPTSQSQPIFDRAFAEYQTVYEQFPASGRIGEAVAKMASFFYQKQDYARAIDVFENVFDDHPDAAFLDVILFNYGRCLYRLERKSEARHKFDQLIAEYPESPLATEAKQISDALVKSGF